MNKVWNDQEFPVGRLHQLRAAINRRLTNTGHLLRGSAQRAPQLVRPLRTTECLFRPRQLAFEKGADPIELFSGHRLKP